jgi:hypothetical protein
LFGFWHVVTLPQTISRLWVEYIPFMGYYEVMDMHIETRTQYVVRRLREAMPRNWPEISEKSGVPEKTIYKIAYRETKDPRSSTLDALHSYFEQHDPGR